MSGPPNLLPKNQARRARRTVHRETFRTPRLLDFCSERELVKQIGHPVDQWPLVVLKELIDNALDNVEEADIAPEIRVEVTDGQIVISDNGSGIPAETISGILDFSVRVSSREAYCSPTRGAQGNALKTIVAMAFALDGTDHATHHEQASMIRRYLIWRNNHAYDERLRRIIDRANVA